MIPRAAVQAAVESLASGDAAEAERILLDALENDAPRKPDVKCPECSFTTPFPGTLVDHRRWIHGREEGE